MSRTNDWAVTTCLVGASFSAARFEHLLLLIMRNRSFTLSQTLVSPFVIRVGRKIMGDGFISYLRVSTDRQGRSGLGIEAQRFAVATYLAGFGTKPIAEFVEVESGKRTDRPELARALSECRLRSATLVIAKLDRLARDAHFLLGLQRSGIAFTAADMPNANRLTVGIMAMVAEEERRAISERTKAALAAAKARGVKLGGRPESLKNRELGRKRGADARRAKAAARAKDLAPVIEAIRADGITSATGIAKALNERGIPTARGGKWQAVQVQRLERAKS
jgi:DNA invertase Pin-like site-specific DNA recombinase